MKRWIVLATGMVTLLAGCIVAPPQEEHRHREHHWERDGDRYFERTPGNGWGHGGEH